MPPPLYEAPQGPLRSSKRPVRAWQQGRKALSLTSLYLASCGEQPKAHNPRDLYHPRAAPVVSGSSASGTAGRWRRERWSAGASASRSWAPTTGPDATVGEWRVRRADNGRWLTIGTGQQVAVRSYELWPLYARRPSGGPRVESAQHPDRQGGGLNASQEPNGPSAWRRQRQDYWYVEVAWSQWQFTLGCPRGVSWIVLVAGGFVVVTSLVNGFTANPQQGEGWIGGPIEAAFAGGPLVAIGFGLRSPRRVVARRTAIASLALALLVGFVLVMQLLDPNETASDRLLNSLALAMYITAFTVEFPAFTGRWATRDTSARP